MFRASHLLDNEDSSNSIPISKKEILIFQPSSMICTELKPTHRDRSYLYLYVWELPPRGLSPYVFKLLEMIDDEW